jgi:hypothetical protein
MKNLFFIIIFFSHFAFCQKFEQGTLNQSEKNKLFDELNKLTNIKIDSLKTVIINFYDKPQVKPNGSCIDYYTSDNDYLKFIKKNPTILQFFVSQKNYKYRKKNVIEDKDNKIRELIFEKAKPCGNYLIIKPNGNFLKVFGEYHQDAIQVIVEKI